MLDSFELSLCQMQGHLFELSAHKGFDSKLFVQAFMCGSVAADLDKPFNHAQWAGEAYLLSRLAEEEPQSTKRGIALDSEVLFWCGYTYRYWHFYTGEASSIIYKQASISLMQKVYLPYHTMSVAMAIDRLKETYAESQ